MKTPALLSLLLALPAFSGPLAQGERDRALSELHATRKQLLDGVADLTPAQWNFKPSPRSWSIAEITEHLAVTEDSLFERVTGKILNTPARPAPATGVNDKDEMVLRTIADRSTRRQAPEGVAPKHRWASSQEAVEHFRAARDRTIAYIRTTGDDLRAHAMEHPAVGLIDAYQWFLLDAAHTARHMAQIAEVKADPHFPRK